jgi:transcriptional regulator with XRE-family HTH domain
MEQFKTAAVAVADEGDNFNIELGQRLYTIRTIKKMSRDTLGECMGITGQQIRKYEMGENRMMPERIQACGEIFKVPVGYFYGEGEKAVSYDKTSLTIASAINEIENEKVKQAVYYLALAIQNAYDDEV